jgi:hypothetical protein
VLPGRRHRTRRRRADQADAIGAWLAAMPDPRRVLWPMTRSIAGSALAAVLGTAPRPPATELRTAVITVTLDDPVIEPDYALYMACCAGFPGHSTRPREAMPDVDAVVLIWSRRDAAARQLFRSGCCR